MTITAQLQDIMTTDFSVDAGTLQEAYEKLVKLAISLGVKEVVISNREEYPFGWNGETIRLESKSRIVYDLAHELSHFICARPRRRHSVEFGLGVGFSTSSKGAELARQAIDATEKEISYEEECVCVLAALILDWLGLPNLDESQFVCFVIDVKLEKGLRKKVPKMINDMVAWGVIKSDLELTFSLRV